MKGPPRRASILVTSILVLLASSLLPLLVVGLASYSIAANILRSELIRSSARLQGKVAANVSLELQSMQSAARNLIENAEMRAALRGDRSGRGTGQATISAIIRDAVISSTLPLQVFTLGKDGEVTGNGELFRLDFPLVAASAVQASDWYKRLFRLKRRAFYIGNLESYSAEATGRYLYLGENVIDSGDYLGTIVLGLPVSSFSRQLNDLKITDDTFVGMIDGSGEVILKSEDSAGELPRGVLGSRADFGGSGTYTTRNDSATRIVTFQAVSSFDWRIVSVTPQRAILGKLGLLRNLSLGIILVSSLFVILVIVFIRRGFVSPIVYLGRLASKVREGDLSAESTLSRRDEIGALSDDFNGMVRSIRSYVDTIRRDERLQRDLEFRVLMAQIKPHFLYNALNSIKWMAEIKEEKGIAKSIATLVKMLEYGITDRRAFVRVSEEVEYLGWFIHLSNLRYGNRIDCSFEIGEGMGEACIPRLAIQPLVENAIYHGLAGTGGTWRLSVRVTGGEALGVEVEDRGRGIVPARLEELRVLLRESKGADEESGSIGLRNVQERIRVKFGEGYGLAIESEEGAGTIVRLSLPIVHRTEIGELDAPHDS
jgi:two-component system, sensor histidine kinase YesM